MKDTTGEAQCTKNTKSTQVFVQRYEKTGHLKGMILYFKKEENFRYWLLESSERLKHQGIPAQYLNVVGLILYYIHINTIQ